MRCGDSVTVATYTTWAIIKQAKKLENFIEVLMISEHQHGTKEDSRMPFFFSDSLRYFYNKITRTFTASENSLQFSLNEQCTIDVESTGHICVNAKIL